MLQYAAACASKRSRGRPSRGSLAEALIFAAEGDEGVLLDEGLDLNDEDGGMTPGLVRVAVTQLLVDAKVKYFRTDHRGNEYSIVDEALSEFARWYAMPWE